MRGGYSKGTVIMRVQWVTVIIAFFAGCSGGCPGQSVRCCRFPLENLGFLHINRWRIGRLIGFAGAIGEFVGRVQGRFAVLYCIV